LLGELDNIRANIPKGDSACIVAQKVSSTTGGIDGGFIGLREAAHKFPNGTGCIELVEFFFKVFATVKHKYFLEQFFFGDGNIINDVYELCLDVRIIVKKGIAIEFGVKEL